MLPKIRNETDYREALADIEYLMDLDPDPSSYDGKELDELIDAVEDYEDDEDPYLWTMGVDEYDYLP